ncbi:hypothetical protein CHLRE_17g692564v5 [Chlamydomonas reinhardtii]|uniref:Uncharacterized protein n=1 Tax=Chlamydomonas reinhardtii TaxID=3055 RepID=A0A2K3CNL3_CHLRE|nr:uncharacterized protein CHLRE_17g692564v5 [Chlamydomonas reinhardtii]PNW69870.1 hypothetical protein CHLRE_17g692564v5 [Chlamydomonas reinhardtii]
MRQRGRPPAGVPTPAAGSAAAVAATRYCQPHARLEVASAIAAQRGAAHRGAAQQPRLVNDLAGAHSSYP